MALTKGSTKRREHTNGQEHLTFEDSSSRLSQAVALVDASGNHLGTQTNPLPISNGAGMLPADAVHVHLLKDGSGTRSMVYDGSVTPGTWKIGPGAGVIWSISSVIIAVVGANMTAGKYGSLSALTNGITLKVLDSGDNVLFDMFGGHQIKQNHEFYHDAGVVQTYAVGSGDDVISTEIVLLDQYGSNLLLDGDSGERLEMVISDDLSTLTEQVVSAFGRVVS
jgi:hypothetical protein